MKKSGFILVKTTYPNSSAGKKLAKILAKILLEKKLAACVQLAPVESFYFWQGEIKNDRELLVTIKTKNSLYKKIEKVISENHLYDIPQIFSIQLNEGSKPYLDWIDSATKT